MIAPKHKPLLGKLLIDRGVLSAGQLATALDEQKRSGTRIGDTLVALGLVSRRQLKLALAEQRLKWMAAAIGAFIVGLQPPSAAARSFFDNTIETGNTVSPPAGFISFCMTHEDACAATPNASSIMEATGERMDQLDTVQAKVNAAVQPRLDPAHVWDYPVNGTGDCNKFALEKRRELIALGWPEQSLLLAVVLTEHNEGHLVLVARTSRGDFVLDNRVNQVVVWTRLPYHWLSLQSGTDSTQWLQVAG
jgi:predicted transglutaminase-like cysteine proteinase